MKNYEDTIKFVDTKKSVITTEDFKKNNITYYSINKLIKNNIIERLSRGIYIKTSEFDDEYYIYQQKYKSIVYSFNTALFLLNKTEVTPDALDVTVIRGYNVHRFPSNFRVHYTTKKNLNLGVIKVESYYGNIIKVYNLERTICDLIKSNNPGIDNEQIYKIIRNNFYHKTIDYSKLIEYSKTLKCYDKIKSIMEVLS